MISSYGRPSARSAIAACSVGANSIIAPHRAVPEPIAGQNREALTEANRTCELKKKLVLKFRKLIQRPIAVLSLAFCKGTSMVRGADASSNPACADYFGRQISAFWYFAIYRLI